MVDQSPLFCKYYPHKKLVLLKEDEGKNMAQESEQYCYWCYCNCYLMFRWKYFHFLFCTPILNQVVLKIAENITLSSLSLSVFITYWTHLNSNRRHTTLFISMAGVQKIKGFWQKLMRWESWIACILKEEESLYKSTTKWENIRDSCICSVLENFPPLIQLYAS